MADDETETLRPPHEAGVPEITAVSPPAADPTPPRAESSPGAYLVVFERTDSRVAPLPAQGDLFVSGGSGDGDKVRLSAETDGAARARLIVTRSEFRWVPTGTGGPAWLNGDAIDEECSLQAGDTISLGDATLVLHASGQRASRALLEYPRFRARAATDIKRNGERGKPCAIVAVQLESRGETQRQAAAMLVSQLRKGDVCAWECEQRLLVLLDGAPATGAMAAAARLLGSIAGIDPEARAGVAAFPADGSDADALFECARAAASGASPGRAAGANNQRRTVEIGEERAIVVEPAMIRVFDLIQSRLASASMPVLILGETGTGKELVATALHRWSPRGRGPMMSLNCAAIPEALVESELFGYERGAFSGANSSKPGLIEAAAHGTVFLDEVAELPPAVQAKLLRVLETRRYRRLGDVREREAHVRVVAATHRKLEDEVDAGRFRRDLYFRLKGATLWLPPLRERTHELPVLSQALLADACSRASRTPMTISPDGMRELSSYEWPGNVRELRSLMEYVAAISVEETFEARHLQSWTRSHQRTVATTTDAPAEAAGGDATPTFRPIDDEVRELERSRMLAALVATNGNRTRAATLISMPLRTFVTKLKLYDLGSVCPRGARSAH